MNSSNKPSWINSTILLGYGFITVLTPGFNSIDTNGAKFLALSLLNLLIIVYYFITLKKEKSNNNFNFIKADIGLLFTLYILFSAISIINSINPIESIVHLSKVIQIFTATIIVSNIIYKDKKYLNYLIIGMVLLLIVDSLKAYSEIAKFINRDINDIIDIKGGYSNKNIFSAAILIKIPFSLYLMTFQNAWKKTTGILGIVLGVTALLFLSTRSMYLGIIFISLFFIIFLIILRYKTKDKKIINTIYIYTLSIFASIIIYSITQTNLYPKVESIYNENITNRLTTIQSEVGGSQRWNSWIYTLDLIKKNPLLGVGIGNWKISVLEKENPTRENFTYHLKNHNDFLEIIAEIGLLGGLCFIFIFLYTFHNIYKCLIKGQNKENLDLLFLSSFGLLAYSFDAFFNFPQDRPEIQSLFIIYLGISVVVSGKWLENNTKFINHKIIKKYTGKLNLKLLLIPILLQLSSAYILYLNVKSLQIQLIFKAEENNPKIDSKFLIENFPEIPNLTYVSEPINTLIANKLLKEKRYNDIIPILGENPSPYDSRREFYLSLAYFNLNKLDSAEYFIKKSYKLKPKNFTYLKTYSNILVEKGREEKAIELHNEFLKLNKTEIEAWKNIAFLNSKIGNKKEAMQIIDSAYLHFPADTTLEKLKLHYTYNYRIPHYQEALKYYKEGDFKRAAYFFQLSESDFEKFGKPNDLPEFLNSWGHSLLEINEILKAKSIFERVYTNYPKNYFALKSLGFISFQYLKNYKKAIDYYTQSLLANSPDYFQSYVNLATIYLIQNQKDLAISNYENSLKFGTSEVAVRNLSLLWKEKGDSEKSQYYQSLISK